jgi:uridine phosphorylase
MQLNSEADFVLNPDGSIYHMNLFPEDVADTIILVGDPDRVARISQHFDRIDRKVQKREFVTHVGWIGKKRLNVLSTGISTANIDIAINELDALVNVDLQNRALKEDTRSLNFIRIGTSGSLQKELPVDSFIASSFGLGLDNLLAFYQRNLNEREEELQKSWNEYEQQHLQLPNSAHVAAAHPQLLLSLAQKVTKGITLTAPGFYGPQGRKIRLDPIDPMQHLDRFSRFDFRGLKITNFEMETSAIYGLSNMLGHRGLSFNAIIANRAAQQFSKDPKKSVDNLIVKVLKLISEHDI